MPAGRHVIAATLDGQPWKGMVEARPEDAERLDGQLQVLLSDSEAGRATRPFIDFNHEGKAAAAIPKKFFWRDGIRLAVDWTTAGLEALRGRVFAYFSPQFDLKDGRPHSILTIGPIGGLTNQPAFTAIQRLSASHNTAESMNKLIGTLVQLGLVADGVEDEMKIIDAVRATVGRIQAEATTAKEKAAAASASEGVIAAELAEFRRAKDESMEAEVDGLIKAGAISAESRRFFVESLKRDEVGTRTLLATFKPARGVAPVKVSFTVPGSAAERLRTEIANEPDPRKRQALRVANWGVLSGQAA